MKIGMIEEDKDVEEEVEIEEEAELEELEEIQMKRKYILIMNIMAIHQMPLKYMTLIGSV